MNDKQIIKVSLNCVRLGWQVERFRTLLVCLEDKVFQDQYNGILSALDADIALWIESITRSVDQGLDLAKRLIDNVE